MAAWTRGLRGTCRASRLLSSSSSTAREVVDEMIAFARTQCRGQPMQATDILQSGLATQSSKVAQGRLLLALADVEADSGNWMAASRHAASALDAATSDILEAREDAITAAEIEVAAVAKKIQLYLVQGLDVEAITMASKAVDLARLAFHQPGAEALRWQALVDANSLAGLAQHAAGDLARAAASLGVGEVLTEHFDARRGGAPHGRDPLVPGALQRAAALRFASGEAEEAQAQFERAVVAVEAALADGQSPAPASRVQLPLAALAEVRASALAGSAQAAMEAKAWDAAEDKLSRALTTAEEISGENHPRVAMVLLLLGNLYARTARVTHAEGLYRAAAKILRLDPTRDADQARPVGVHSSVAAVLSWRFAQLLTALPKRSTEAGAWAALARTLFRRRMGFERDIEAVLGGIERAKGTGPSGSNCIMDVAIKRALPCAQLPTADA